MRIVYVSERNNALQNFVDDGIFQYINSSPSYWYKNESSTPYCFIYFFLKCNLQAKDSCRIDDENIHIDQKKK